MDLRDTLQSALGASYLLERELGGGGMSRVFLATESALGRRVVIKVMPPDLAHVLSGDRFRQEIRLAARLQHPHIVPVLTGGQADRGSDRQAEMGALLYYTMPYVEGESVRARLALSGEFPVREAVRILRDVAAALAYAHEQGVVHRDIKPDNVLLSRGEAMVTDFGVAKAVSASATGSASGLTSLGMALGTPAYMAPEQAAGDPGTDHRADLYAWGCVAYELLTGEPPFAGRPAAALLAAHVAESPEPLMRRRPTVPPALSSLVMRCLAKRPADRPQSAAEIIGELEALPSQEGSTPAATVPTPVARTRRRSSLLAAAAIVVLLAGAGLLLRARGTPSAPPSETGPRSIAVLPFTNLGGDSSNLYLSDGISQEILAALGQVPGLAVAGRTSSFRFRGTDLNAQQVGRELNVASLLSGTIQRTGDAVRVTAELVDARTGFQLWSSRYDRSFANVFALEDEIAGAIIQALSPKLAAGAPGRLVKQETSSAQAHDLALRARALYQQADEAGLERAVALYQQALKLDSTYAGAWAGLSNTYGQLADAYRAPREMVPKARAAALRAVALDDNLAEGHQALAVVYNAWDWDFPAAAREFRRSLALDPGASEAHLWYGIHLSMVAMDSAGGAREMRRAAELDPLNPMVPYYWSGAAYRAGDYRAALAQADRLHQLTGMRVYYGTNMTATVYAAMGQWQDCVSASAPDSLTPRAASDSTILAICLAHLGQREHALSAVKRLEDASRRRYVDGVGVAYLYFALGDLDRGFAWLQRAYNDRSANMTGLRVDFDVPDAARRDPRYAALLARMGLPRTGPPYPVNEN